jgi:GNAT superfamily N-acetyltransferase
MSDLSIRAATESDVAMLFSMIKELAVYEKLLDEVTATEEKLRETLFAARPYAETLLGCVDEVPVAFAVYFTTFSTFLAQPGIYLEDLYVKPEHRGCGLGRKLITEVARIAVSRGCGRYEWAVLDWNTPAIDFYQKLGAEMTDEWRRMRISGDKLEAMARL